MSWKIRFTKNADKGRLKLMRTGRRKELEVLAVLIEKLKESGPIQPEFHNYSKLGKDGYHCHLSRKWVACWREIKNTIILEIYYVGSREDAPH
jgi:hypothetical protein